jgi:hypoxanthine phosphoribosyltransferase
MAPPPGVLRAPNAKQRAASPRPGVLRAPNAKQRAAPPPRDTVKVLYAAGAIARRVARLAKAIAAELGGDIHLIAILKGSFVFAADLIRALHRAGLRPRVDFITLSSYGAGSTGNARIAVNRALSDELRGRSVLLVDDILETGRTLAKAKRILLRRGAAGVKICVLLDKSAHRQPVIAADFVGFECPDRFVVGYGLDFAHHYRELPYVGVIARAKRARSK